MILPLDNTIELKHKCKSDNERKHNYKVGTLYKKIKIVHNVRGSMSAAAVGLLITN
jgi:hypothetical protein